ncbi:TRAP transporter substrate-binding protein [Nioella sp.]|uniref:TRAP transporter substrate-binding protein n=1 Tax=Nioella sp. TaxID=1912091 RepID=UPI0035120203
MTNYRKTLGLGACLMLLGNLMVTQATADTTLTFASAAPAPAPINRAFEQWAQMVNEATGGEVTINVVAGGTLGRNGQLLDRVQSGVIDIAWDFQGYYPNRFPLSSVAELPFIYETALEGSIATQSLFDEGVISGEYDDFVTIGLFAFPNNSVILSQPLPDDGMLTGLKLSAQNPTMYAALEALGGVPVAMGIGDWYPAISRGTIDGAIVAFTAVPAFRFQEVTSYYYKAALGGNTGFTVMNRAAFDALPEEAREALMSVSGEAFAAHMGAFLNEQAAAGEGLAATTAEEIVEIEGEQVDMWRAALEGIEAAWIDAGPGDADTVAAMRSAVESARQ